MENKIILITGGAGSIGSELARQLAPKNRVVIWDIDETRMFDLVEELKHEGCNIDGHVVDVRNRQAILDGNPDFTPNYIFHCAARKHVSPMEQTPLEAVSVNIQGTYNIIQLALDTEALMVNVSTDKVVNANCIMGATKKVAEIMVRNAGQISVRFGNVMGSRGSVIPIWQRQLDTNKALTVTDAKMRRYMMTIPEACSLIIKAAEVGDPSQVYILDMGEPVNILDLAEQILQKSGKNLGIKMIGMRPGETLDEKLMTEDEERMAVKKDNFWILNAKAN